MDPIARRFMWDIISRMTTKDKECSVILTTHSMEEAESLCNNIGIMVRRPACLSPPVHDAARDNAFRAPAASLASARGDDD